MTSNSNNNSYKTDYYDKMPDEEFNIFCERFKILHQTGKYIPPPPKINVCKDIKINKRDKPKKYEPKSEDEVLNTRYGKGLIGRGHGSCKVKYCTCCNKRRCELEQYTSRMLGKDFKEKLYPLSDTTKLDCQNKRDDSTKENLFRNTSEDTKPSTSSILAENSQSMSFAKVKMNNADEVHGLSSNIVAERSITNGNLVTQYSGLLESLRTTKYEQEIIEESLAYKDYDSQENVIETSYEFHNFENSFITIDDTQSPTEDSIIDLDSSKFVVPHPTINLLDDSSASLENGWISPGTSEDVEIVNIYKISTPKRKIPTLTSTQLKTRSKSAAESPRTKRIQTRFSRRSSQSPRKRTLSITTANKKITENSKSQSKEKIILNNSGSKPRCIGDCPVCLESLQNKEIMSTICGHVFCAICIQNCIRQTKSCPNCRKHLTLKSIHPIYL